MRKIINAAYSLPYSALMKQWKIEFLKSIKSPDTEDRIDLIFYRPLGFLLAKLSGKIGLSPTHVTMLGLLAGIVAGFLFSSPTYLHLSVATLLFLLSGILDSADGQLARLTGRSTTFGLVLDGLCDNIVFIAVYLGCIWAVLPVTGPWIWPVAFLAGFSHSWQSAAVDFYGREYLYYTTGLSAHYRNPTREEARAGILRAKSRKEGWLWRLRYSWIWQQQLINTRAGEIQALYHQAWEKNPDSFRRIYREHHLRQLKIWQVLGTNMHTLGIILFAFLAQFDLYLALVNLGALNLWMIYARRSQLAADSRMARQLEKHFPAERSSISLPLTGGSFDAENA